ncbi:3-oxoacyl-[acyl-carrier-protein] synthase III C-terminal domain-containing protein [Streptomyces sp. NPDC056773]|uniref:3-oxoacyl-[acyl-carrier-protein] synthase III C-terminal domain-containing protein n=1 Tax=unclassified Streptomyces TaxID=2593676 RepID=UPI0036D07BEE
MSASETANPPAPAAYAYPFPYRISGVGAQIGEIVSVEDWARLAHIPHRKRAGEEISGSDIQRILGVTSKSWDRERFASLDTVVDVARSALRSALAEPEDIDAVFVATCTPYEIMLDQDAFNLLRRLRIPDSVPPFQLGAGCGGLSRVAAHLARTGTRRALVISYNAASPIGIDENGIISQYSGADGEHPFAHTLWCSGALFSDAATALVFERDESFDAGLGFYSRDSLDFGGEPGFSDPLIHYPGGGAAHPPGFPGSAELSAFGLNGPELARYYSRGMMLNQETMDAHRPGFVDEVRRIYTHQAGPALVEDYHKLAGLDTRKAPAHARELGNLVTSATPVLFYTDVINGLVGAEDTVCFSVIGAGPERGAFLTRVAIPGEVTVTAPLPPVPAAAEFAGAARAADSPGAIRTTARATATGATATA